MMNIKDFTKEMAEMLKERLPETVRTEVSEVTKLNGQILNGILIKKEGGSAAPVYYMENAFENYKKGIPMEEICDDIARRFTDAEAEREDIPDVNGLQDFDKVKDRIVFRLVNTERNQVLLSEVPHIPYFDLSIIFYLNFKENEHGMMAAMVRNSLAESWGTDAEKLYETALQNTKKLFPPNVRNIADLLPMLSECPGLFYIITNRFGSFGAGVVIYPGVLKRLSQETDSDLILLPSSVHEFLAVPYNMEQKKLKLEFYREMVQSINKTDVAVEDVLSDSVYVYIKSLDKIIIAE